MQIVIDVLVCGEWEKKCVWANGSKSGMARWNESNDESGEEWTNILWLIIFM